jgi:hypothetical protein
VARANVHSNTVTLTTPPPGAVALGLATSRIGFLGTFQQSDFLHTRQNCFTWNSYDLRATKAKVFFYGGAVTDDVWRTSGCNANESITR